MPAPERAWSAEAFAELRATAEAAPAHGLRLEQEKLERLDRLDRLARRDAAAARAFDRAADELFERLALAFAMGAVDPALVDPNWRIGRPAAPDVIVLRQSVAAGASPAAILAALLPDEPDYSALAAELARVSVETEEAEGLSRAARIERLRVNLERWRWMPRDLPSRRIDVLVPFFVLRVRDGEQIVASHNVIVGARRTPTPSFAAAIETLTLNPSWTPPASIVHGELAPRFHRDPGAAAREGFDVIDAAGQIVDPASVNWRARPFPYMLRQRPGPGNALGRLRFDLPNRYAVYLHDTPSRGLFARANRALSHGCIRVENPLDLAINVLADPVWDIAALEAAIAEGATQIAPLDPPLPIHIVYFTAAPGPGGEIVYADDIYGRDAAVLRALDNEAPAARPAVRAGLGATECGARRRVKTTAPRKSLFKA